MVLDTEALNKLKPEQIKELIRKQKEVDFFSPLVERLIAVEGKKGCGKTCLGVAIAFKLKSLFGIPVLSDQPLKNKFGEYTYFNEKKLLEELKKTTSLARGLTQEDIDEQVDWVFNKEKIKLRESILLLDESYKLFDSRTPMDKLTRSFGYYIAQSRHFKTTVILMVPDRNQLDKRVRGQLDVVARPAFNPYTKIIFARFLDFTTGKTRVIKVNGPKYFAMYDSWAPIAMRAITLRVNTD